MKSLFQRIKQTMFKQFTKCCYVHFIVTMLLAKKWTKENVLWGEKREGKEEQCYHHDICRWKRSSFPNKHEIRGETDLKF